MPEPPKSFHALRYTLVNMSDYERAYLRRWVSRWIDKDGKLITERSVYKYPPPLHFDKPPNVKRPDR
jgi:hypothetical protein